MSSKHLLIVIPYFVPARSYGGPVKVAYEHALGLIEYGREVTVVTTDAFDANKRVAIQKENLDGIEVIRFKNLSNYLAKFHNFYVPVGMRKWLKNNIKNYNIVHIHDILNLPAWWAMKFSLKNKINYFIQPHGILSTVRIEAKKTIIKNKILKYMNFYFKHAKGFLALTQNEQLEINQFTENTNIHILPNGMNMGTFKNLRPINLRKKYGLDEDTVIFSFLGRIQYIKGLDIALRFLYEYNKYNKNWIYLIIGPDEGEKSKLIKLAEKLGISNKLIWYGIAYGEEKYNLLASTNLFLFTSRNEGFGLVILEAIFSGVPVLMSKECPLPEVQVNKCGSYIDFNELASFLKITNEWKEREYKINSKGIKNLEKIFDEKIISLRLHNIYLA